MSVNVLIIVAHPDDEVLGMGGTILKHFKKGDSVTIAYLTTGITSRRSTDFKNSTNYSSSNKEKLEMGKQIKKLCEDARAACKILKVKDNIFFDLPDNEMDTVSPSKIKKIIKKILKEKKPERIYTSHYGDLNVDHRIVCDSVLATCESVKSNVNEIFCFEILSSTEWAFPYTFRPNYFVDIKNEISEKIQAMKCYKNEIRKFPHPRSVEGIKNASLRWGTVSGLKCAEAFELIKKFD